MKIWYIKEARHKYNFHFNMGKIGEKYLAGTQYIDILVIGIKEIGTPSIPILNIFDKM